jgi:hypothetical protein
LTDADLIAGLAAQLEELRGQLARTQGEVGSLRERLTAESGQTAMLRLDCKPQRDQLNKAISKHKVASPPAPYWSGLTREDHAERLGELRGWIEGFLRPHYPGVTSQPGTATQLARCWANHPDAIWELSTLMAEWTRAYGDEDNRDLQGALVWHDRWLPATLARLAKAIKCDEAGCRAGLPYQTP